MIWHCSSSLHKMHSEAHKSRGRWSVFILCLGLVIFGTNLARIGASYNSDGLIKYIQAYSLASSRFHSEELHYPGKFLDPEYKLYPFRAQYLLQFDGRNLGQYPLVFSVLMALPVTLLPPASIPFLCLGVAFLTLLVYWRVFKPSPIVLAYATFATPMITQSMELTEGPFVLLAGLGGLHFFIRAIEGGTIRDAALAGFFSALGVWLRLEALLYSVSLLAAWILISRKTIGTRHYMAFAIAAGLVFASFMLFNFWDYGHPLGTRFIANLSEPKPGVGPIERITQTITLVFGWKMKLGFFGYSPLLIVPAVYFAFANRDNTTTRILLLFLAGFLLVAGMIAPNDGIVTWGSRYMALALFPALLLLDRFLKLQIQQKGKLRNALFLCGLAYSVVLSFITLSIQRHASKDQSSIQGEIESTNGDVVIFPSQLLSSYSGLYYFKKPIFAVWNPEQMRDLVMAIKAHRPMRVSFVEYSGWTAREFATALQVEFGQDKIPAYLQSLAAFKTLETHKGKHLTIHEFVTE